MAALPAGRLGQPARDGRAGIQPQAPSAGPGHLLHEPVHRRPRLTIVNVALPSIQRDLHASVSGLQWTVDAYTLVLASFLMLSGSTGDRIGRRRIFQAGLGLFTLGSLLCSLAPGLGWLVAFRMLQALGGSMLNPVAMSIITQHLHRPGRAGPRDRHLGRRVRHQHGAGPGDRRRPGRRRSAGGGSSGSTSRSGWRRIVLTALFVPESRAPRARRRGPGWPGAGHHAAGVADLRDHRGLQAAGWGSARILGCFARRRRGTDRPGRTGSHAATSRCIDLRFFRSAPFSGATVIAVCAFAALGGFLFLNTLYLQDVRGYSALHAGLFTLPMAAMTVVLRAAVRPHRRCPRTAAAADSGRASRSWPAAPC